MKMKLLIGLVAGLAVAVLAVLLDPTYVLRGVLRGQSFFQGRPTSYWHRELQSEDPAVAAEAQRRLREGSVAAVSVLAELLGELPGSDGQGAEVRRQAADLLRELGP